MAKCKCRSKSRMISNIVSTIDETCAGKCGDVCSNPVCADPSMLGIMAPLIYDEIGINLCAQFPIGTDIATTYPTVTNASIDLIDATYTYGDGNVQIETLAGRKNCYNVILSNLTIQFALHLYDASCRLVATLYPTAVYLPADTTAPTYDEDTNPSSVELGIFAPYGLSYTAGATPTPQINFIGHTTTNSVIHQGINLFGMSKILDLDVTESTVTVGLTLVLQSLYYVGYKVKSAGKIDIPKGSILTPEDSDCMRFVAGGLLNLAIKPLDLGYPKHEECEKIECNNCDGSDSEFCENTTCDECGRHSERECTTCRGGTFTNCSNACTNGAVDDTTTIIQ